MPKGVAVCICAEQLERPFAGKLAAMNGNINGSEKSVIRWSGCLHMHGNGRALSESLTVNGVAMVAQEKRKTLKRPHRNTNVR